MKPTRLLILGFVLASALVTSATASANLSPAALRSCQHAHLMSTLCSQGGHYATVVGKRVFMLNQSVAPAHTAALGNQYLNNQGNVRCLSKFGTTSNWTGMYICNLSANQTWNIFVWNANTWGLQNKGNGNCLNDRYGQPTVGQVMITYQCQNSYPNRWSLNAQRGGFEIRAVDASEAGGGNHLTNNCVSSYGSLSDGQPAQLAACNGSANQTWGRD